MLSSKFCTRVEREIYQKPASYRSLTNNHPGFKSKFNNIVVLPLADPPTIRPLILLGNSGLLNLVVFSLFHDKSLISISILNIILYLNIKTDMKHINNNFDCVKCKRKTETRDLLNDKSKNNRPMLRGICTVCGTTKTQFVNNEKGGDLIGSLNSVTKNIKQPWARFPWEMHLPGHSFTGPDTRLDLRLKPDGVPKTFSEPVDRFDKAALPHDLAYAQYPNTASRNVADRKMVDELNKIPNPTFRERVERAIVKPILPTKAKLGLGLASSDSKSNLKLKWTDQLAEELHKPVLENFRKRRVYVKGIDEIWSADLIDMQSFAEYNDGFKYLLSVVDIFSKYGWIVPLKDKSGKSVSQAFEKIFTSSERKPKKLW